MRTPSRPRLTLFVPGLFREPLATFEGTGQHTSTLVPFALAKLLARADRQNYPVSGVEPLLFNLFGQDVMEGQDLPVAAVTRLADMGIVDREWWIRADPVNLEPTRNGLLMQAGLDLNQDEANRLVAELSEALAQDGWLLKAPRPERWYLKPPVTPDIATTPLTQAMGQDIHPLLPRGRERKAWHTHLNEFQILLHTSTVNVERQARGALPANSVWFWGGGRLPQSLQSGWTQVWSVEPLSQGLARLGGIPSFAVPPDARQWLQAAQGAGDHLVVLDGLSRATEASSWQASLRQLEENWFAPLVTAVHAGMINEFQLLSDTGLLHQYRRLHRWRFWRRSYSLDRYRAA